MHDDYLNGIADHGASLITHVSLADGPLVGDELAVTRQVITWGNAASGDISATNQPTFDPVPGGSTVRYVQFWGAAAGGIYYGSSEVTEEVFGSDGVYTIETADIEHNAV